MIRRADDRARLLRDVPGELKVWASHGDFVAAPPPGFTVTATSSNAPVAAMECPDRGFYALLFHPEVAHTDRGTEILRNFAFDVCGCSGDWTIQSFIEESTARIAAQVGDGRVVCALSGGVDSTVAATLIHNAVGDRLECIFVDKRPAAAERGAAGAGALQEAPPAGALRRRHRGLPRAPGRRRRSRAEAQDHRRHLHRRLRGRGDEARPLRLPRPGHALPGRHRVGVGAGRRRPSRATTTSAGCPSACSSVSSSRFGSCSRTRSGPSAATSASTRSSWSGSPSRAPAWRCACSAI